MQDMVSGDEIISDTWNLKEVDDIVYEIDCKKVTKGADTFGETPKPLWPAPFRRRAGRITLRTRG